MKWLTMFFYLFALILLVSCNDTHKKSLPDLDNDETRKRVNSFIIATKPGILVMQGKETVYGLVKMWESLELKKRESIETILMMNLGLSDTGSIELIGGYYTGSPEKREQLLHFVHSDLFGERLMWICLVNVEQETVWVLYHVDHQRIGEIIHFSPQQ